MSVNPVFPAVFAGGQMTDLPQFTGTLDGTEIMEIVAAGAGQSVATQGVNYQITSAQLAALLIALTLETVVITNGEYTSAIAPFEPGPQVSRIYIDKSAVEPTYIKFNPATTYVVEPLVRDIGGALDGVTAIIHCSFSNSEQADGNANVPIGVPYGGYIFRPIGSLTTWALGSA